MFSLRVSPEPSAATGLGALKASVDEAVRRLDDRQKVDPADFAQTMKLREDTHHLGRSGLIHLKDLPLLDRFKLLNKCMGAPSIYTVPYNTVSDLGRRLGGSNPPLFD